MIEVWYDVYDGSEKKEETQNKAEALATVLNNNLRGRTKTWTYRLRRQQVSNSETSLEQPPAPSFDSLSTPSTSPSRMGSSCLYT